MNANGAVEDLAGRQHWEAVYRSGEEITGEWSPSSYDAMVLKRILLGECERAEAKDILEVGCGNSTWLPYLARVTGASVAGIDYSETGCQLARWRLEQAGIPDRIICGDLFKVTAREAGQFDLVYSLGLAEHFSDLRRVLVKLAEFVRPGGILLTEAPNLYRSFHGWMGRVWQPELLAKHCPMDLEGLLSAYRSIGMTEIRGGYCGLFSMNIVAWELYPRWPRLAKATLPLVRRLNRWTDATLRRLDSYRALALFSPFLYASGTKLANDRTGE